MAGFSEAGIFLSVSAEPGAVAIATIATDKSVYPRAMPAFLNVGIPGKSGYRGYMMVQDTGGAIRAAGRADIYMGTGPGAEEVAGRQLNEGELYYIAVK